MTTHHQSNQPNTQETTTMTTTTRTPPTNAAAVKLGFWNCCQARPAYALAFDADDGSTVWHWACSSCTHSSFGQDAAAKMAVSDRVIAKADLDTTTQPNTQETTMNATTYATRVRDAHLGMDHCPECGRPASTIEDQPEEAALHAMGHGLVIVGCEGYWTVDPALVGLERGQWQAPAS